MQPVVSYNLLSTSSYLNLNYHATYSTSVLTMQLGKKRLEENVSTIYNQV